ncbi:mitogen-activated protein kinase binding protein 1 [Rhizopus stolonifer]|uniref:Mitogen-activated protein kinase binding protein 1 n=1 Tax=Rhizopus stolonifer TaxID=4846 RepID=A0A367KSS6_RHIST|nr:mitogen-activated protein kinase binding protein 1 [Rhizopus stolonifer]
MQEVFTVNSGNVPPPTHSTHLLSHQLSFNNTFPVNNNNNNNLRRKPKHVKPEPKLKLDRILGLTSTSSQIMDTANDLIAYAAGAVVVLYHQKRNKQIAFLYPPPTTTTATTAATTNLTTNNITATPLVVPITSNNEPLTTQSTEEKKNTLASTRAKPISCLAFSPDGNYLAVGETGHQPRILIWDVKERTITREFRSHKFGVLSLSFSPNMRYLVSVGFQHDGYLYVWDWKKGVKLAGNKVTSRVNAVSFSRDGSFFVTAGLRHVKFWYLDARGRIPKKGLTRETQVLDGRSGLLGVLRDANFVDVACDQSSSSGYTYFVTDSGILCTFKEERVIDKWVNLQVKSSFSIAVSSTFVICTCSEGVIRLFEPVTLNYLGILPKPHPLGVDISSITSPDMIRTTDDTHVYPDAVAIVYDDEAHRVTAVYSDRSLYIWDIHDLQKIGKYRSFIFHSDCVWGVEPCPNEENAIIPTHSFATFSGDGTIRIWNLETSVSSTSSSPQNIMSPSTSTYTNRRNIYSRELVKMLYVDSDAAEFSKQVKNQDEDQYPDYGIRSLKMSADGKWMASGDRSGNLRVHDMHTWDLKSYQEAHDSEILTIDISTGKDAPHLIATGSRDRLLHIFDMHSDCQLVQSLDDHSSSITAVKFSKDATQLISSGADKGIIFRHRQHPITPFHTSSPRPYTTYHNHSGRGTVFDMALDTGGRYVASVTGERKLYVFSVESGKPFRVCKPETPDEVGKEQSGGSLINIDLDPFSGTFAVTSGSDKCIRLFDLTNSTCIEKVGAHAELITAVRFVRTSEKDVRVISTCSDGTIFVWKVDSDIVAKMCARGGMKIKPEQKRLRRASTAIRPTASISQMIRQGERKTFSTVSTAEHRYDEMYRKIEANRPQEVKKSPPNGRMERLLNGYPTQKKPTLVRPTPPPVQNKMMNINIRRTPGRNPIMDRDISPPPLVRKSSHVITKRASQPVLGNPAALNDQRRASDSHSKPIMQEEEEEENNGDIEEEEDEDEEEEIIFTPEQEKINTPFELPEEDGRTTPTSDTSHSAEEEEDQSSVDDDAIIRDLTSLEAPRVSASVSRTKARRSAHLEEDKRRDSKAKRQSMTALFLSLMNGMDTNQKPSIDHVLDAFKELDKSPSVHSKEPAPPLLLDSAKKVDEKLDSIDLVEQTNSTYPVNTVKSLPLKKLSVEDLSVETLPAENQPVENPQAGSIMNSKEENAMKIMEPSSPVEATKGISVEQEEEDPKLEGALADIDGISILLDSVLDALLNTTKTVENEKSISVIEKKLENVADKIASRLAENKLPENEPPETARLLEKYSNLLLNMVERKLKP